MNPKHTGIGGGGVRERWGGWAEGVGVGGSQAAK
jgi:hypothetical protein